jgi:hypothetical protein
MTNDLNNIPASVRDVLKDAFYELNAIRARDGAPQHIDWLGGRPLQTSSCTHEWWSELTDKVDAAHAFISKLCQPNIVIVDLDDAKNIKRMIAACNGLEDLEDCMVAALAALKGEK